MTAEPILPVHLRRLPISKAKGPEGSPRGRRFASGQVVRVPRRVLRAFEHQRIELRLAHLRAHSNLKPGEPGEFNLIMRAVYGGDSLDLLPPAVRWTR